MQRPSGPRVRRVTAAPGSACQRALPWLLAVALSAATAAAADEDAMSSTAAASVPDYGAVQGVQLDRLAGLGLAGGLAHWAGYSYFNRAWYQGQRRNSIRWLQDWDGNTYVHMDKGGHFFSGLVLSRSLGDAYRWTGFGERSAAALGALTSWGLTFEVEMRDAYFDQWGFSVPDFLADTIGASVPLVHTLFPATRVVGFKFSWWPSPLYLDYDKRLAADRPRTRYAIDDYEGMTFWLTVAVNDVLPAPLESRWPDWLGLALGYGATGMHGANVKSRGPEREYPGLPSARPELLLSLDVDARRLPGNNRLWQSFRPQLNWWHLPAPAVRFYPDLRFYLLYL